MRIAIVGTELCAVDARGGGLEQVLRRWAQALADRHDVLVVTHAPGDRALVLSGEERYETVRVDGLRQLASLRADVVSLHNRPGWATQFGAASSVAVTFHNYPAAWKSRSRTFVGHVNLSAVSQVLADTAASRLGAPVDVVPPSIDPAFYRKGRWRPTPTVLSPNRLMHKKGVLELLEIAARPAFGGVQFEFADLLSPWLRPTAEHRRLRMAIRAVPNASLFPPPPDPASLVERYRGAGVVVCAAQEPEGLGLVPLEAQAAGVPVVTTDAGGLREATFPPNQCVPTEALGEALLAALAQTTFDPEPARAAVLARHAPATSTAAFERWLLTSLR